MKVESDKQIPTFAKSGAELRISFNVVETEREDMGGEKRKVFVGEQVVVPTTAGYGEIVEAIVASHYTTGAEISLSRKADDDAAKVEYLAFVAQAKELATGAVK